MSFDQYSGGPAAGLARALAGAGQGYEEGIDEKLQRQAQQAATANAQNVEPNLLATEAAHIQELYPGMDTTAAMNQARYIHGMPPLPVSPAPNPPAPSPSVPVQPVPRPNNMAANAPSNKPISLAPPFPVPNPGQPVSQSAVPPAPVPARPAPMPLSSFVMPGQMSGMFPPPATAPPIPRPPMPVPAMTPVSSGIPAVTRATIPVPPGAQSVPPAPPVPIPQQSAVVPSPDTSGAVPYKSFDPEKSLIDQYGPTANMRLWGVRNQPKLQGDKDTLLKNFQGSICNAGVLPGDTADVIAQKTQAQLALAKTYDQTLGDGSNMFQSQIMQNGAYPALNKDVNTAQRTDVMGQHYQNQDSVSQQKQNTLVSTDEQKSLKAIEDTPVGFQQRAAVNAWNNQHPGDQLPVPDGINVQYYKNGNTEQSLIDQRSANAAYTGQKSKYYAGYIASVVGKDNADAYLANQRGIILPQQLQNQINKTAQTGAYNDGMLRLQEYGLNNTQQRFNVLMQNGQYKTLVSQDSALRAQIDSLNNQKRLAAEKLYGQALSDFQKGTDAQITDIAQKQQDVESKRQAIESDPTFSMPQMPNTPVIAPVVQRSPSLGGNPGQQPSSGKVIEGKYNGQPFTFHAPREGHPEDFNALSPAKQQIYRQWYKEQLAQGK